MNGRLSFGSAPLSQNSVQERAILTRSDGPCAFGKGAATLEVDPMFEITLLDVATVAALALGASLTGSAIAAETKSDALNGTELRQAVSGKTVYLNLSGFELPIRYAASGTMAGSMGVIAASLARGDGASDHGRWWIAGDQLCQRWSSWMDGKSYCYQLTLKGTSVRWVRNDGHSGTARIGG
jgi:hypothetical protein